MCVLINLFFFFVYIFSFIVYVFDEGCLFLIVKCYMFGKSYVINLIGWKNLIEFFLVKKLMIGYKKFFIFWDMWRLVLLLLLYKLIGVILYLVFLIYELVLF